MRRAFTLIEILLAAVLLAILTSLTMMTFNSVTHGWQVSTDYLDKMQRTDFALNQVVSGLRSLYYPHGGEQSYDYGFYLTDNGNGEDPDRSDVIEWSKRGSAIVGTKSAAADTVHRVQLMVLEEGNHDYIDPIEVTGLYARHCPDVTLRPKDNRDDIDFTIGGMDAKAYASQGQTRTAALAVKLAEVEIFKELAGEYPVLILDDVMSELDLPRRRKLLKRVEGLQTILTCTHAERVLYGAEAHKIRIDGGKIVGEKQP